MARRYLTQNSLFFFQGSQQRSKLIEEQAVAEFLTNHSRTIFFGKLLQIFVEWPTPMIYIKMWSTFAAAVSNVLTNSLIAMAPPIN